MLHKSAIVACTVDVLTVRKSSSKNCQYFGIRSFIVDRRILAEGQMRMSASTFRSGLTSSSGYKCARQPSAPSPLLLSLPPYPHYVWPWSRSHFPLLFLHSFLAQVAAHMPISMSIHRLFRKLLPPQMDSPNPSNKISPPSASPTP